MHARKKLQKAQEKIALVRDFLLRRRSFAYRKSFITH